MPQLQMLILKLSPQCIWGDNHAYNLHVGVGDTIFIIFTDRDTIPKFEWLIR